MSIRKFIQASKVDVIAVDKHFLKIKIYAIAEGETNNNSNFLPESLDNPPENYYNKPILALYNKKYDDCEEHNCGVTIDENSNAVDDYMTENSISPCGVVPESAIITKEKYKGKNFVVINECIIWSTYARQIANLIKRNKYKNVSVEVDFLDYYVEDDIEYVKKYDFLGVVILGERYKPGIDNAHLETSDYVESGKFENYKKALFNAIDKKELLSKYGMTEGKTKKLAINKDEYGTGSAYKVDKSKESVSNSTWSEVDKIELRDDILKASNYKELINDVYLDVQDGWEDEPSEKLKYPVMQKIDDTFVYNANGLLSAQQYGEKYDETVAKKAHNIREKLELVKPEKEAKKNMKDENVVVVEPEVQENFAEENVKLKEECIKLASECEMLTNKCAAMEKEFSDLRMTDMKSYAKSVFEDDMDEDDCLEDDEKETMMKMVEDGTCDCKETFTREFAYVKFLKKASRKIEDKEAKNSKFVCGVPHVSTKNKAQDIDPLDKI